MEKKKIGDVASLQRNSNNNQYSMLIKDKALKKQGLTREELMQTPLPKKETKQLGLPEQPKHYKPQKIQKEQKS